MDRSSTATTLTSGPVVPYTWPALPAAGKYTVTFALGGFLPQTQQSSWAPVRPRRWSTRC
jgi:hypothetical protein